MDINSLKEALRKGNVVLDRGNLVIANTDRAAALPKPVLDAEIVRGNVTRTADGGGADPGLSPTPVQLKPTVWA